MSVISNEYCSVESDFALEWEQIPRNEHQRLCRTFPGGKMWKIRSIIDISQVNGELESASCSRRMIGTCISLSLVSSWWMLAAASIPLKEVSSTAYR